MHAVLFHISIHTAPKIVAKLNLVLSSYINIHLVKMAARGKRDSVEVELGSRASYGGASHSVQKMLKDVSKIVRALLHSAWLLKTNLHILPAIFKQTLVLSIDNLFPDFDSHNKHTI